MHIRCNSVGKSIEMNEWVGLGGLELWSTLEHIKHFICGSKSLVRFTGHPKKRLNDPLTQGLWTQWRICQTHVVGLEKASSFGPVSSRFPIQPRYHPFRLVKSFHIWDTHQASWATSLSQILLWLARWWRYRDRSKLRSLKGCILGPVCHTEIKFYTLVPLLPRRGFLIPKGSLLEHFYMLYALLVIVY